MIVSRLRSEYGVAVEIAPAEYSAARWVGNPGQPPAPGGKSVVGVDREQRRVILFASEWDLGYFERHHPNVLLLAESPVADPALG